MTGRDEILLAHGCDVKGFYRGDAVRLDDGRTGLVLDSDPCWHTTVLLTPREQMTVLTATLAHMPMPILPLVHRFSQPRPNDPDRCRCGAMTWAEAKRWWLTETGLAAARARQVEYCHE